MTFRDRPIRLEQLAPGYLEVWEQDRQRPELYHYEGETLTGDALRRHEDTSPGLIVVRIFQTDLLSRTPPKHLERR